MKKCLILLFMLFVITGCKANVHVTIDKSEVTEKINIYAGNSTTYNDIRTGGSFPVPLYYDQKLKDPIWMPNRNKESGVSYYDTQFNSNSNIINASGRFNIKDYNRSMLVRNCFELFNVITESDGSVIFSTSKGVACDVSNFSIIVDTPYKVVTNNAHKVDTQNNIYTWNVTDSNFDTVSVFMQIDFSKKYNGKEETNSNEENTYYEENEKKNSSNFALVYLIIGIPLLILIIFGVLMLNKKRKDNLSI